MTRKTTPARPAVREREPGCDYPACERPGSILITVTTGLERRPFVVRLCAMHDRPLARSTATEHAKRKALRKAATDL